MKKYQIFEKAGKFNHAGSKATADIGEVANDMGFKKANVNMITQKKSAVAKLERQIGYFSGYLNCYNKISHGSAVLLQHPFHYPQLTRVITLDKLKKDKKVKFISLVHDVEELRAFRYNDYYRMEFEKMMEIADVLIVHNDVMKSFFVERGFPEERIVCLEIFDYLQEGDIPPEPKFETSITIAGNLDTVKCEYIGQLGMLDGVKVNLYGPNYDQLLDHYSNITYHGSFPTDEIPLKLTSGFGLVWDGESLLGCKGDSGQYLKYNNPHKLSLYLSSGLPVVIWSGAAEADFVRKNNVGICVESLNELTDIFAEFDEDKYKELTENVRNLSVKLRRGDYARAAIEKAEKIIGDFE